MLKRVENFIGYLGSTDGDVFSRVSNPITNPDGVITKLKPEKDHPFSKIVFQIKDNEIIATFYGAAEASRTTGISRASICDCCRGEQKTAGGYQWKYK